MINIFIQSPLAKDANSMWRCMGPMSYLAKNSQGKVQIHLPIEGVALSWDTLCQFDIIFMHRPCRPDDLTVMKIANNLNIPVWIDYDDWLFHLPEWNPQADTYHNTSLQQLMAQIIACADVVSVSTQELYKQFIKINQNVVVIPNAYRSDLYPYRNIEQLPRKDIYMWRGTNTHEGDLLSVKEAFTCLTFPVHFLGAPTRHVTSTMKQLNPESCVTVGMNDMYLYMKYIYELAPKVVLFPLADCFFNRCKSNIAYIEAMHAGALCIAPLMPEWTKPGIIPYYSDDWENFFDQAEAVMHLTPDDFSHQQEMGFTEMKKMYDITVINEIRKAVVISIVSSSFVRNGKSPYEPLVGAWALSKLMGDE